VDLLIAIIAILVVFFLAAFGGHVSAKGSGQKKLFWVLGMVGVFATIAQTIRQQRSQSAFEIALETLTETSLKTVTGGDSFCFIQMQIGQDGIYPIVLSIGKYPVYDLTLRQWDPEDWTAPLLTSPHDRFAKVASETSILGTLPNDDYKNIREMPLPTRDKRYDAEFSARNGSWSQEMMLRSTPAGWKFATLVRKSRRVAKTAGERYGQPLCYHVDPDFPEKELNEMRRWVQNAPKCEAGSHP